MISNLSDKIQPSVLNKNSILHEIGKLERLIDKAEYYSNLIALIRRLPESIRLVGLRGKNPAVNGTGWYEKDFSHQSIIDGLTSEKFDGVGLKFGQGWIGLDEDGKSSSSIIGDNPVPDTWLTTSQKPGRKCSIYYLASWEELEPKLRGKWEERTGVIDEWGKEEGLEVRYRGHQSVIGGINPDNGKFYKLLGLEPFVKVEPPQWVVDKITKSETKPKTERTYVINETEQLKRIKSYLAAIPVVGIGYKIWIEIGQAIHSDGDGPEYLQLWKDWSSRDSEEYDEELCDSKWESFGGERGIKLGTLGHHAKCYGWKSKRYETKDNGDIVVDWTDTKLNKYSRLYGFVKEELADRLSYDPHKLQVMIDNKEVDDSYLQFEIATRLNAPVGVEDVRRVVGSFAKANSMSAVEQYLIDQYNKRNIDGVKNIKRIASEAYGFTNELYFTYLTKTMVAAVARAMEPGCKVDTVFILVGPQGIKKTTSLRDLFGNDNFAENNGEGSDKDILMQLYRRWCIELGEISYVFTKQAKEKLKQFLSKQHDDFRALYDARIETHDRHFILVGSSNQEDLLSDDTGERRYWVAKVEQHIDLDLIRDLRDAAWAEAVALYFSGYKWWLSEDEQTFSNIHNKEFEEKGAWYEVIEAWVKGCGDAYTKGFSTATILQHVLQKDIGKCLKRDEKEVARILKSLGYQQTPNPVHIDGAKSRAWMKAVV